jgi:Asp-tRNA(Asn)/Glu-tRNA(Gln) amidotransferase A subunit family amidase
MADTELHALTIAELAPLLKKREISPVELTAAYLERIDAVDSTLNAYITIMADAAQAQAQERDAELIARRPDRPQRFVRYRRGAYDRRLSHLCRPRPR